MTCLSDFFNQRGDLFEKAVKPFAVSGPESKKFLIALDTEMHASESEPFIKMLVELSHTCPSLHIAITLLSDESDDQTLARLHQDGYIKALKL